MNWRAKPAQRTIERSLRTSVTNRATNQSDVSGSSILLRVACNRQHVQSTSGDIEGREACDEAIEQEDMSCFTGVYGCNYQPEPTSEKMTASIAY
jgi:hypothetical protein